MSDLKFLKLCSVDVNSAGHASSAKNGNTRGSKVKPNFLATVARTTKTEKLGWQIEKGVVVS